MNYKNPEKSKKSLKKAIKGLEPVLKLRKGISLFLPHLVALLTHLTSVNFLQIVHYLKKILPRHLHKIAHDLRQKILRRALAIFCVIFAVAIIAFFSSRTFSSSLPDCSTISGTAEPGTNCLFFGLPLCTSSLTNHRVDCADLIDLPLCSDIDSTNSLGQLSGKNCVKECSDSAFDNADTTLVRGTDYAIHNEDCIRFCDSPESGITANSGVNCVARKCNQLSSTQTPSDGSNCDMLDCNLLTSDELNDTKFSNYPEKKYCNGDGVKCYDFIQSQLPYLVTRTENTMCELHNCPPSSSSCTDDTTNITSKGTSFQTDYETYITSGYSISTYCTTSSTCTNPIAYRQYRCSPTTDSNPTTANPSCDTSGDGATCSSGYCYKTIDCNLSANSTETECLSSDDSGETDLEDDELDSWFYRPKPMTKALKSTSSGTLNDMSSSLCYSKSQMEDSGWGWHPQIKIPFIGTIDLGYYHSMLWPDSTRSPGMCSTPEGGIRGVGYPYLCGNGGMLYKKVSEETAYHRGYASTYYSDSDGTHKITVCLRFKNLLRPDDGKSETCGARECGISCAFGVCESQHCGYDFCKTLTVKDSDPTRCMMSSSIFTADSFNDIADSNSLINNTSDGDCMSVIDSNLRVRAVKYNNRICTFLDVKGQLAYDMDFFDGSEQLSDGTCISGTSDDNGGCTGSKNTEDDKGEATKWRTIIQIPYIQQVGNLGGYYDKDGKFFKEQECAKVALRIGPPKLYNLSTMNNSITLFTPPLYILNAMTKRDGDVATPSSGEDYGKTDFHYPEIEVKFGSESKKLSLGIGYIGDETSNPDENGSVTLTSTIGSVGAEAEVFVKKGFEISNYQPTFCLYRKVKDQDGVYQNPVKVQCIKRNFPEIDNASSRAIDSTLNPQKIVISADSENTFSSSKIVIKYLGGFGTNGIDDSCGSDDSCTNSVSLSNSDTSTTTCDSSLESYKICVQREKCSELNNECAQNEINIQNATAAGTSTASYLVTKSYCDDNLLAICNAKKGITSSSTISDFYQNSSITANYPNAYGWFNEICLSSGFSTKLKTVIAYKIDSNVDGKCKVKSTSPYLNDSDPNTNCDDGGEYPNCLCQEYVDGVTLDSDETSRTETAHEAGLCIDIPTPKTCSTIDYNPSPNSDSSDLEYISSSLGKTSYNDSTGVHASHQLRSNGSTTGHAEFSFALLGMNSISGTCNGFWQYNKNSSGVSLIPKMNCLNVNGIGQWDTTVTNPCIRYSCSAITTSEPNSSGSYGGVYDKNEIGENKGSNHGFAIWPAHTQTTDFPESYSATSCITGFKLLNSTTIKSNGVITGYSGGTLPSRNCDQLGNSKTPTNSCERISCSAINPTIPSSSSDSSAWAEWYDSGGATFSSVYASRSSTGIQSESISYGTCQESLGFFQANGASPPYRECDYLGNWGEVKNKCLTQCDAISTAAIASDSGHGYAYWSVGYGEVVATSTGCVSGYVQYPYPPRNKTDGSSYTLVSDGSQNYTTTIPEDISSDNRSASLPQRTCQQATFGGSANVWTNPSSSCVNKCPGSGTDSRINAGKTRHSTSSGTVDISWNDTDLGETAYIYSPDPTQNGAQVHTAAEYSYGRANDYYILARKCGSDGKWETPIPQCATNGGEILDSSASAEGQDSNATYTTLPSGSEQIVALGSTSSSGTCQSGYYKGSYNTATVSSYTCSYKDSNYKIDEVYYKYASGSDCEKYCTLTNNQTFTNSYFGGTLTNSGYYDVNSSVTLKCNSNYGSAIVYSGSRTTNTSYDCGETAAGGSSYYTSSIGYRGTTYPSSTCRSDGTWSSVSNACTSCRTCSYSANFNPIYGTTSIDADLCGDDGDFNFGGNSSYGTEGYNSDQTPLYSNSHNSGDYPLNNQDLTYCYSISSDISSCSESQFSSIIQGTKVNTSSSSNTLNHNNSMACVGRYRNESNNCSTDHAKGMIKYTCTDGVAFAKSICKWSW